MATCNVQTLLDNASCFACLPPGMWALLELQLLCEIAAVSSASGGAFSGAGSPEGVVTANPGSTYVDTTGHTFWLKESGTGNTGWVQYI